MHAEQSVHGACTGLIGCLDPMLYMFLAAMSSSRSDVVTQFVCPFVCLTPFIFNVFGVFKPKEFQRCFKKLGRFKEVSGMLQESFKGASSRIEWCFVGVLLVFQA